MSRKLRARRALLPLAGALVLIAFVVAAPVSAAGRKPPPRNVKTVVGCLLSRPVQEQVLHDLGLKVGEVAAVRYYQGSISGIPESDGYFVLLYSRDKSLAWLLMAEPAARDRVWPYHGAFNYSRERGHLEVEEGFGGLATYKTFGDFAREMEANRPLIRVRLQACSACCGPAPMG